MAAHNQEGTSRMKDTISVFSGIKPKPLSSIPWMKALENIKSDRYKQYITKARKIENLDDYREFKKKLPSVTFCGEFKDNRQMDKVVSATGFIIPDIDHLADVEPVFRLLEQDKNIWFAFRSPSGDGIKCGIRCQNIASDDDIKSVYTSVARYFSDIYGIKIDPACKDISRLTFLSWDPDMFINPNPQYFDPLKWLKPREAPTYIPPPPSTDNGWKDRYGLKVIESCCNEIRNSPRGEQHYTRLKKARLIGGFIGEYISEDFALSELEKAVIDSGARDVKSAMKTILDGIEYGKGSPIVVPEIDNCNKKQDIEYYFDIDEVTKSIQSNQSNHGIQEYAEVNGGNQDCRQEAPEEQTKPPYNLAASIREYIINSTGSFTVDQIDREFCLTTRKEKVNRSKALSIYKELELIKADRRFKGKYHIIDSQIDFIDLNAADETPFPILLPFNLHSYVKIPRKAIIIIAGTSNAGKTAIILNTLRINLTQKYKKMYLMSEMGSGEYKSRIMSFGMPISEWKDVKAASKSYDFDGAIQGHNKDGLTCIDYLEEVDGEYFKIASSIRDIYDSLNNGVAIINIQKKTGSEFARGGEATKEKARLYLTLDFMLAKETSIICALRVSKIKEFKGKNLLDHEIHFELTQGAVITALNEWTPSRLINRNKCIAEYEGGSSPEAQAEEGYPFKTIDGPVVRIKSDQLQKWQETFPHINVDRECAMISEDSFNKPFLKYKSYFFQIPGILHKKNKQQAGDK